jgi:[ribosomal protein S18]-alanine N-acetyltransferase
VIHIQKMDAGDLDAVSEIEKTCFSMPWSRDGFADTLAMKEAIFLVAKNEETVVGYVGMYTAADEGEITNVAVAPSFRRQNVAKKLMEALQAQAIDLEIARIFLEVRPSNDAAIRLYETCGYKKLGIRRNFYQKPKEDALIYCKVLEQPEA